jgi:transcriptional regulator with PAS, ATPase and Fis domain
MSFFALKLKDFQMARESTYEELKQKIKELEQRKAPFENPMRHSKNEMESRVENTKTFAKIVTNNEAMLSIFQYIDSIAHTSQPVLITGETGVGKELIAKSIHALSKLNGRFVAVNVAGLDDNFFSDTLFGHAKGAFTGAEKVRQGLIEQAANGTLFLDEIGDLSLVSQVRLLRLLQECEYLPLGQDEIKQSNARIITSTNKDLWSLQRIGKFRRDLNFRLRTHHIHIPPLRERRDDIPLLVDHFLDKSARSLNKKKPTPPKELYTLLETYSFPGNIRELEFMIFDAVSGHRSKMLSLDTIMAYINREQDILKTAIKIEPERNIYVAFGDKLPTIKQTTQMLVVEAVKRANGNLAIAASMLGISRQALSKRIKGENLEFRQKL